MKNETVVVKSLSGIYDVFQDFANELKLEGFRYGARPIIGEAYEVTKRVKHPDAGKKVCGMVFTTEDILVLTGSNGEQFMIEEGCTETIGE
jgi:hypothetical protein